ncbi:MAG: urea amidolyase associated protein UAAP1 [Pseudomonadota bacterium]
MTRPLFSEDVIAAAKSRYAELKARGQDGGGFAARVATTASLPETLPADKIRLTDTIPGGWYWHGIVRCGEALRIVNRDGTHGASLLLWNATEPSERLNPADTIKVQWTARIGKGRVFLSDMGRAIASVLDDTSGGSDFVAGGSTPFSNARKYGDATLFNARDHFLKAAAKYGLGKRDVGPCVTLFAPIVTDDDGSLVWDETADLIGARIDLRAEMNVIAAVANCPHPLSPSDAYGPEPITVTVWRHGSPEPDDLARTGTEEALRTFDNTDQLFEQEAGGSAQ